MLYVLVSLAALGIVAALVALATLDVSPRLAGPYLERRAEGYPWLASLSRAVSSKLVRADRGDALPHLEYPEWIGPAAVRSARADPGELRQVLVLDVAQALAAFEDARAGDTITFAPGRYRFEGRAIAARAAARADAPIVVRSERLGTVRLQFALEAGIEVSGPYWVFENLVIEGACAEHDACEHAFHVLGGARHVRIRNNELRDFNAHVKINGSGGRFPDFGAIERNRLVNTAPRRTADPVTPIDLVGASHWRISGNLIADFVKDGGDQTSYGAFAKGGGVGNRFTGNVVVCEQRLRGAPGRRIGLSFGGGGSAREVCRDRRCIVEHEGGVMHSNLIAACSDAGIYINRSSRTQVVHNTLLDTAGVLVSGYETVVGVVANLVDGPVAARDGASLDLHDNRATSMWALYAGWHPVRGLFRDAAALDLAWRSEAPESVRHDATPDLCGVARMRSIVGAFDDFAACTARGAGRAEGGVK